MTEQVGAWQKRRLIALRSAKQLYEAEDWWGCANRSYYVAYQAATGTCIAHGDAPNFPPGWNNPAHEQLPGLIRNNGDLPVSTRRVVSTNLRYLRSVREDADYKPGRTVNQAIARRCISVATSIFNLLEVENTDEQA